MTSDFKFVKILLVHQKFSPKLRNCISGKMAFDLIIWGYQSNYESISANDIQPGYCAFFDFENENDEEPKSIQILFCFVDRFWNAFRKEFGSILSIFCKHICIIVDQLW